jgi:biopolymer transport protein ExbD
MSSSAKIQVGLLVLALSIIVLLGCMLWLQTRQFEPVNMAVSLKAGEVHTTDFQTNLTETYTVHFYGGPSNDQTFEECPARTWADIHWAVDRLSAGAAPRKKFLASSDDAVAPGWFTYGFTVRPGRYRLEWQVAPEAACLDAYRPRLSISADSGIYKQFVGLIQFASVFLDAAGVILVLRGLGSLLLGFLKIGCPPRIFPDLALRNVLPLRRHRPMPLIKDAPHFPLCFGGILMIVMFVLIIFENPLTSRGFLVLMEKANPVAWEKSPWPKSMSVYVDSSKGFLVNGRHVEPQDLSKTLKEELDKRMVWTVYFEAAEDTRFSDAEFAMKTIQDLRARLIWLTPRTREEMNQNASN